MKRFFIFDPDYSLLGSLRDVAITCAFVMVALASGAFALATLLGVAYLQLTSRGLGGTFVILIVTALGSVIASAWLATVIHRSYLRSAKIDYGSRDPETDFGEVFRTYVFRFGWIVALLSGSYGASRLLESIVIGVSSGTP